MSALRSSRLTLLLGTAAIAAVALTGCSIGGSGSGTSSEQTRSPKASSSATSDADGGSDAAATGGCPANVEQTLKQVTDSGTKTAVGTVDDLAFPGDGSLFAKACIFTTETAQGNSAIAIVPGDASVASQITAPIEAAGFTPLSQSEGTSLYSKDKEVWIVTTVGSDTPLPGGVGNAFTGPHLTVAHTITP